MIKKQKDDIREEYKEIRRQMSAEEKQKRDAAICAAAENLVSFRYAEYVLLYAATSDEIDVSAIAEAAFAKGKKVLFPRCDKKTHTMKYHEVKSLDELQPDTYGIRRRKTLFTMHSAIPAGPSASFRDWSTIRQATVLGTERASTTVISPRFPAVRSVWSTPTTF